MDKTVKISIIDRREPLECAPGVVLLDAIRSAGVAMESPCSGKGLCGKCKVRVLYGVAPSPKEDERRLLSVSEIESGFRLACLLSVDSDLTIDIPHEETGHKILTSGTKPDFQFELSIRKEVLDAPSRSPDCNSPYEELLAGAVPSLAKMTLPLLQTLTPLDGGYKTSEKHLTVVWDGDSPLAIEAGDTSDAIYGIAVDIGTTTVAVALVNLKNGEELGTSSAVNPQKNHGLDVLSRIDYARRLGAAGRHILQSLIAQALDEMAVSLCAECGVEARSVYSITVAANVTMLHLFLGIDPVSIGVAPFAPVFLRALSVRSSDVGLRSFPSAMLFTLPSVSAYIGADIVAGAYVCGMAKQKENVLFIDIGTNGEIVLASKGRLMSCSCAAGPALEGMNISCGMRAAAGAIEDVSIFSDRRAENALRLKVIGDVPPVGICGSGILSAIRELLRVGLIQKDGYMLSKEDLTPDNPLLSILCVYDGKSAARLSPQPHEVVITQKDVRQVQLAKGAILSGFMALLKKAGLEMDDVRRVLVAGQFGAHLPVESLTGCGVLPDILKNRVEYVGNTSVAGAYMAMMSRVARKEMEELAGEIEYTELSMMDGYQDIFLDSLEFPTFKKNS
ncbi:ferredoxin [Synergistales bacterium]|nr:ferredoxin [Synergistales bacterium]